MMNIQLHTDDILHTAQSVAYQVTQPVRQAGRLTHVDMDTGQAKHEACYFLHPHSNNHFQATYATDFRCKLHLMNNENVRVQLSIWYVRTESLPPILYKHLDKSTNHQMTLKHTLHTPSLYDSCLYCHHPY